MGSPSGRKTRWGEEGAPQRGGLPVVKRRVSSTQAEVAPDERPWLLLERICAQYGLIFNGS